MSKSRILVAALALVVVSAGAAAAQQSAEQKQASKPATKKESKKPVMKEQTPGLLSKARVSADSAERLAMARQPSAELTKEEIREEKGKLTYSFYFKDPHKSGRDVVDVDAATGSVAAARHLTREAAKAERKSPTATSSAKKSA
jgi:hypothetical protein